MSLQRVMFVVVLCAWGAWAPAQEKPRVELPPEMKVTEPKIPEEITGRLRTLNEELSKGLAPADNAAVHLLHILGAEAYPPTLIDAALSMMGVESISGDAPEVISSRKFLQQKAGPRLEPSPVEVNALQMQLQVMNDAPWTAARLPLAAAYLEANASALDRSARLVQLPGYYAPVLSEDTPPQILSANYGLEYRLTALASLHCSRAMYYAGEGRKPDSIAELLTCHRYARMLAKGSPFDVSFSKAHLIDAYAFHVASHLIQSGTFNAADAAFYLAEFSQLPGIPLADVAADRGERATIQQEAEILSQSETTVRDYLSIPEEKPLSFPKELKLSDLDWKKVNQISMEEQDKVVSILRIKPFEEIVKRLAAIEQEQVAWHERSDLLASPEANGADLTLEEVPSWVGLTVAMSLRTNAWQRRATDDRAQTRDAMLKTSLALAVYAGQKGKYPDSLEALVPAILKELPQDGHTQKAIMYEKRADGTAVLTSWGYNRVNDAGKVLNDDTIVTLPAVSK